MRKLWTTPQHDLTIGQRVQGDQLAQGTITWAHPFSDVVKVHYDGHKKPAVVNINSFTPI